MLPAGASSDDPVFQQSIAALVHLSRGNPVLIGVGRSGSPSDLTKRRLMELAGSPVTDEEIDFASQAKMLQSAISQAKGRSFLHDTPTVLDGPFLDAVTPVSPIVITREAVAQQALVTAPAGYSISALHRGWLATTY